MRFRLLGILEVRSTDNAQAVLARARHRQVLANPLRTPNLVMSAAQLIDS